MAESKITICSSGGESGASRPVLEMKSAKDFSESGIERIFNLTNIVKAKISEKPLFIFAETTTVTKYIIGQLMATFEVLSLTPDKWDSFKIDDLENAKGREIIWINFWGDGFIEKMIERGLIQSNHWIMAMCKTEEKKEEYRKAAKYVEFWFNSEMDGGIKFPECDTYHRLSHGFSVDPYWEFINSENNCICKYQSKTFQVEKKLKSE